MKVYLVVNCAVEDGCDLGMGTSCYDSIDKARNVFKDIVFDEKQAIDGREWIIEETNESFCAYESGDYAQNHTFCEIRELNIE